MLFLQVKKETWCEQLKPYVEPTSSVRFSLMIILTLTNNVVMCAILIFFLLFYVLFIYRYIYILYKVCIMCGSVRVYA